jgi:hypothetical protein
MLPPFGPAVAAPAAVVLLFAGFGAAAFLLLPHATATRATTARSTAIALTFIGRCKDFMSDSSPNLVQAGSVDW